MRSFKGTLNYVGQGFHLLPRTNRETAEPVPFPWRPRFKHQELDLTHTSIRFIRVLRDLSAEGLVQCSVEHPSLDGHSIPEYTCLSYVWGHSKHNGGPFNILLNGQVYSIFHNLHEFLKVARKKYGNEKRFWIDAICIDQSNAKERNHQVRQMAQIYQQAFEVIAWLGEDPLVGHAIKMYKNIMDPYLPPALQLANKSSEMQTFGMDAEDLYALNNAVWAYRSRVWITQEIALARRLKLLGHESEVEISYFNPTMENLFVAMSWTETSTLSWPFLVYTENTTAWTNNRGLWKALSDSASKECLIPRDRIYSLLPMFPLLRNLEVDYEISNMELLRRITHALPSGVCICSVDILLDALKIKTSTDVRGIRNAYRDGDSREDPSVFLFELPYHKSHIVDDQPDSNLHTLRRCADCNQEVELRWPGRIWCFHENEILSVHFIWEESTSVRGSELHEAYGEIKCVVRGLRRSIAVPAYLNETRCTLDFTIPLYTAITRLLPSACVFCDLEYTPKYGTIVRFVAK